MAGTGAASPRPPELHQDQDQDLNPYLKEHRLATFAQWPFVSDCSCTPDRMAEAGFIHCPNENAPDVVQCLFCWKELEGWEPDDDPMCVSCKQTMCSASRSILLLLLLGRAPMPLPQLSIPCSPEGRV
ncbi:baculoviral IAP repeat-containing protein 5 isoform X2 [Hemicordylus capensis]|uniref:baculoviral IAP repeat-containing protein 5 isoform X2 n=1 Tax=Hemicordylus capensis TaxID=884348 RepID=UPI002304266E|nr:baculoviral IAP repeat-containing protein 5 isoform X2 [Hemicordylus capensis]